MNIDFPNNPTIGQIYTYSGRSWQWNGFAWDIFGTSGNVVSQLNGFTGNVNLAGGSSISVSNSGNTITISYTGTGGGGAGISGPYVISFNGLTGAVTGVTTGVANTFIPLQTFAAGISSLGGTFSRDIRVRNLDIGQKLSTDSIIIGNSPTMNGVFGGGNNVVIGYDIGSNSPTTVLNSVLMGYQAGQNASVINENVAIGMRSMRSVVNSPNNTAIGALSYQNGNINDGYNTAVGYGALNTSNGGYNTAIGAQTLLVNNEGTYNVAIGYQSLFSNNNGARNVGIGADALYFNSDGNNNVALGYSSLYNNTTGQYNIGIGLNSLLTNESGSDNVSFGRESLKNGSNLSSNVAIGRNALTELTASEQNVGIGIGSLFNLYQFSNNNTAVGSYSGNGVVSATGGVYIGSFAKGISQGQINEIVIGTNAIGLGSNNTVIGATTQTVATIYGLLNAPGGISLSNGITFSDGSFQVTKPQDFLLFVQGII